MGLKNTDQEWGSVAKSFHWIIALLVIGMVPSGIVLEKLDTSIPEQRELFLNIVYWHKSCGVLLLTLLILRLSWRWMSPAIPSLEGIGKTWERHLALTIHGLLYFVLFSQVISGWVMSSAAGHPVTMFGWFELPALVEKNKELAEASDVVHAIGGIPFLILLFTLHLAGALKHHYVNKNNVLKRMLPW